MSPVTTPLPEPTHAEVIRIVRDGTDSDTLPDAAPCTGKIQFTPKQQTYKSSAPALVFYEPVSWWNT